MAEIKVTEGNLTNNDNLGGSDVSVKVTGGGKGGLANITPQPGILMDEKTNAGILQNMQKLADEIQNPWRRVNEGLKDMTAWTQYNKGPAFALREEAAANDRNTLYNIRQQQAAVLQAQQQAQAEAANIARIKQSMAGGAEGAGGPNIAQQQLLNALSTIDPRNVGAQRALIDEFNKHQIKSSTEAQYNPAALEQKSVFIPGVGDIDMSANDWIALPADVKQKYIQDKINRLRGGVQTTAPGAGGAGTANLPIVDRNKSLAMAKTDVPLENLPLPFYGQESEFGKADTRKPGIQGAQGPMQVTKDTFDTYKRKGIIPESYDLNDPGQAYASGVLILNDLHKKHGQDINKIAAEYFGGPGAINADGSININRTDASGKSVGSYINDIRSRMKLPTIDLAGAPAETAVNKTTAPSTSGAPANAPSATTTKAPPPPIGMPDAAVAVSSQIPQFNEPKPNRANFPSKLAADNAEKEWEKRRDAALEIYKKYEETAGAESAKAFGDAEKNFINLTNRDKLSTRQTTVNSLEGWVNKWGGNDRVVGLLAKPDLGNAIADAIRTGINTPVGQFGIAEVERLVQAGMPGLKGEEVQALKQLSSIMGPRILQIVEQTKGSSSDKDWAAYQNIAGSASSGYDFLKKAVEYDKVSLKANKADRSLYDSLISGPQRTDFRGFNANPKRNEIWDEYDKETKRIANTTYTAKKLPPKPPGMPTNVPAKWSESTQSYWIGDKQYKVAQ